MITVYHSDRFTEYFLGNLDKWFEGELEKVAEVDTDEVDVVFQLTNHIGESWTKNPGVEALTSNPRSTSVGDVAEKDGRFYVCASAGWDELTPEQVARLNIKEVA